VFVTLEITKSLGEIVQYDDIQMSMNESCYKVESIEIEIVWHRLCSAVRVAGLAVFRETQRKTHDESDDLILAVLSFA
jgi:hypothetical protein